MMFDPNAPLQDLQTQQQSLEQQRLMAEMLRKRANSAQQPEGQMVGGRYVAPHFLQRLAPILDQLQAGYVQGQVNDQSKQFSQATQQATKDWQSALPRAIAGRSEMAGPPEEGGSPELAAVPAQMPDRGSVLKATLAGLQIPGNRDAAMLYNKAMGDDLTREDTQADRREARAEQSRVQLQIATERAAERSEAARLRSEDARLSIEQRQEAAREAAAARRYAADVMRQIGSMKAAGGGEKELKPLPSSMSQSWVKNASGMASVDNALKVAAANPKAFGVKNYLPDDLTQRLDPKGVDARAAVANLGSLRIHDRSGAAVTAAETPRLKPFIPNARDTYETIEKKLKAFKREYRLIQQEILDYADSQGYKPPGVLPPDDSPAPAAPKPPAGLVLPPGAVYVGPAS